MKLKNHIQDISLKIAILCGFTHAACAMVYDNRYFPLIQYPFITVQDRDSHIAGDFFVTTANRAADILERGIGVFELTGPFDLAQLAYSMELAGFGNPLPARYLNQELPFTMAGKLQTQGFALDWEQNIVSNFSFGLLWLAMRSNSYIDFYINQKIAADFSEADVAELDAIRRQALSTLGLACNHVRQGGSGDTEIYLRWFDHWCYSFKLRSLYYGVRIGALCPSGVTQKPSEPASVPFGGNGFWGTYASVDAEFEIKEDWKIGLWVRISKRFAKTMIERMPVARALVAGQKDAQSSEPQIFGVLEGPVHINPGVTEIFSAYTQWEGIREGLGIRLQYSLIHHHQDHWIDERIDQSVPSNLQPVEERTQWGSEYVTLCAFYDFEKVNACRGHQPILRVSWDIPYSLLVGRRFVHSYKVALGLEFNF